MKKSERIKILKQFSSEELMEEVLRRTVEINNKFPCQENHVIISGVKTTLSVFKPTSTFN